MGAPSSGVVHQLPPASTMAVPAKVTPGVPVTSFVGSNSAPAAAANNPQVLRPPGTTQVVQTQPTVINSAGGVQVVNMRPAGVQNIQNLAALQQQQQSTNNPGAAAAAQRALAPRMVLAPQQVVGARPGQMGITLQALQVGVIRPPSLSTDLCPIPPILLYLHPPFQPYFDPIELGRLNG